MIATSLLPFIIFGFFTIKFVPYTFLFSFSGSLSNMFKILSVFKPNVIKYIEKPVPPNRYKSPEKLSIFLLSSFTKLI